MNLFNLLQKPQPYETDASIWTDKYISPQMHEAHLNPAKLHKEGLEPTWSAWQHRKESLNLAKKLGFVSRPDAKAWIWMEEE